MDRRYMIQVLDHADGKVKTMSISESAYLQMLESLKLEKDIPPPETPVPPKPSYTHVCAECGHETNQQNGPCPRCNSYRVILQSVANKFFGANWRRDCFGKQD